MSERLNSLKPRVDEYLESRGYNDDETCYRYGIIDFLQAYTKKKQLETLYLRKRFSKKPANCFSCVDPGLYGDRFYEFMASNLFTHTRDFPEHELEKGNTVSPIVTEEKKRKKFILF